MTYPRDCDRPHDPRQFQLYWCGACELGQLHPRPQQVEVDGFYAGYYTHTPAEARAAVPYRRGIFERLREKLASVVDDSEDMDARFLHGMVGGMPSRFCDLGCGDGRLIAALRELGHHVVGLEPDPVTLQLAAARGLTVHAGHADALPQRLAGSTFDVVIMSHMLHLCLDPLRVVRNARALLRQGGLLACETTNNDASGLRQQGPCWRWLDMPRHLELFTAASLKRLVTDAGFHVKRVDFTGYARQFKRAWLEDEARKWAVFHPVAPLGARRQLLRNWILLGRTALARPERKYDSVRVIAEAYDKPAGP